MIVFDLETRGFTDEIILGGAFNGRKYTEFTTVKELLDFIVNKNTDLDEEIKIYSHNGGRFDNRILYRWFKEIGLKPYSFLNINGALLFQLEYKGVKMHFRDSFLLMDSSLASLSNAFRVKHRKNTEFDIKKWIATGCPITNDLKHYLKYDVLGLWEVMRKFQASVDVDIGLTMASTSFKDLLASDSGIGGSVEDVTTNYLKKEYEEDIRKAYRGGRSEVFIREAEDFYYYDVNSLYPYVMESREYPVGNYSKAAGKVAKKYFEIGKEGVSYARINAPENMHIPYLCIHINGKLCAPVGVFADWFTNFELRRAIELGYEVEVIEGYCYKSKAAIFKNFVEKHKDRKINARSPVEKYLAKKFLNTSYGKWGQTRTQTQLINDEEFYKAPAGVFVEQVADDLFSFKETSYKNRKINPIYAAYITAYARDVLYSGILSIGEENIIYCDTDSMMTKKPLDDSYIDDNLFGYWAREGKQKYQYGIFIAPKMYALLGYDYKVDRKLKGVPYSVVAGLSIQDYYNLLYTDKKIDVELTRVVGFMESLRRRDTRGKKSSISEITQTKTIKDTFDKREVMEDKINTKPLSINRQ